MNENRKFVEIFAEINEEDEKIFYHAGSWDGPKVVPRRFYPSRLVKLVKKKNKDSDEDSEPELYELGFKAPKDKGINAYILGDASYFSVRRASSITQAPSGPNFQGGIESEESFGSEDTDSHMICVTYCMLSQRDFGKIPQKI